MSHVFVLDTQKQPLSPVHPGRARWLLTTKKAAVYKRYPFTIILMSAIESPQMQPLRIKLDPGSRTTGIAVVDDHSGQVLFGAELTHRGHQIKKALDTRRSIRHTGYEVREYLLEKWVRTCAYCSKQHIPLQIEHIIPRAKGGTDRVSNLTLACEQCNRAKGTQDIAVFLKEKPAVLKRILAQAKASLKDAAAVNSTRWALYKRLKDLGLPVECGSGGMTRFNRQTRHFPKRHWLDAACVGKSTPETVRVKGILPLLITATGHGCRRMCSMDGAGFPRTKPKQKQFTHGFRTGDIVRAKIPGHLNQAGMHVGRMSAKEKGGFTITTARGKITDVGKKYCRVLQRADGYGYSQQCMPVGAFLSSPSSHRHESNQKGFLWKQGG